MIELENEEQLKEEEKKDLVCVKAAEAILKHLEPKLGQMNYAEAQLYREINMVVKRGYLLSYAVKEKK